MSIQSGESGTTAEAFVVRHRNPLAKDYVIVSRVVLMGYPQLSDGAKVTYWVIYSHDWYEAGRGGRKGYVYPTIGRLALLRHTTARTVQRHLAELIEAGLLTRELHRGKPSVLFIEEPSQEEAEHSRKDEDEGGDIFVGGGVTFLSPLQEDKEKQIKPVNAGKEAMMEKRSDGSGGLSPIKALLDSKQFRRKSVKRTDWLADQIVEATGDAKSRGCYMAIAGRCPESLVFEALSLLKEARRDGSIRKSRGALFVGIVRRLCRERGIPDPVNQEADRGRKESEDQRGSPGRKASLEPSGSWPPSSSYISRGSKTQSQGR